MKYNQHPNFISHSKRPSGVFVLVGTIALGAIVAPYLLTPRSSSLAAISIPVTEQEGSAQYTPTSNRVHVQQLTQEAVAGWTVTPSRNVIAYERGSLRATRYTATGEKDATFSPPQVSSLVQAQISSDGMQGLVHTRIAGNEVVLSGPIERPLVNPGLGSGSVLSPDGSRIAFFTIENESTTIWTTGVALNDIPRRVTDVRLQNITLSWLDSTHILILSTNTQQAKSYLLLLNTQTKDLTTLISKKDRIEYNPALQQGDILVSWYDDSSSSPTLALIPITAPSSFTHLPAQTSARKCGWASNEVVICGVPRSGSLQSSLDAEMNSTRDDIVIISTPSLTTRTVPLSEQSTPLSIILPTGIQRSTTYEIVFQNAFDQKLYTAAIPTRGDE